MLSVYKAQRVGPEPVPDLSLAATEEMPELSWEAPMLEQRERFERDASAVVEALYASLPGGTLDQILRLMLERKASQLIVRF